MNTRARTTYFIAAVPTGPARDAVDAFRERIAATFDVRAALALPPHVTLLTPFGTTVPSGAVTDALDEAVADVPAFALDMRDFGSFGDSVWFIEPAPSAELRGLWSRLIDVMRSAGIEERPDRMDPRFHLTLAYKDVTPEVHRRIGAFLREETPPVRELRIDNVTLFAKGPDDPAWRAVHVAPLASSAT